MADEVYNRTLESLQQYIPFLDNMIAQLKDPNKKNREQQLNKMQSLHTMITDKRKKLKLETLIKCEDVISKLYEKVHNKSIGFKKGSEDISSTPASPSPPRETLISTPLTIPMERLEENRIPKIDIYSSAGESLNRLRQQQSIGLGAKVPDMSKPPISLEDLKTLEDDVQEKINESSLNTASLHELNSLRDKLAEQIHIEDVLLKSPQKLKKDELEVINTTVRNNLSLTKKVIQPPDKPKSKDCSKSSPNKRSEFSPVPSLTKKEHKSPKILKEPDSIFGSILSHIDDQILGGKKKKEERRNSATGRDERKSIDKDIKKKDRKRSLSSDTSDEKKDGKDVKEKERSSSSSGDKHKSKDEKKCKGSKESKKERHHHQSGDKSKSKDDKGSDSSEGNKKEDKPNHSVKRKSSENNFSLSGKKTFEAEEELLKRVLQYTDKLKESKDNTNATESEGNDDKDVVGKISVKKDLGVLMPNVGDSKEEPAKPTTFKRLADKYNPKPRKTIVELDVDKEVSDIIEENMKTSPPKIPVINQIPAPIPPPASLLLCSQMEPELTEPPAQPLPTVLQSILAPSTTELINNVVSQLRQNAETDTKKNPVLTPSTETFISDYMREDNFVSDYSTEDYTKDDFPHNNLQINDFNNIQTPQMRRDRLNFEPPSLINNHFNQVSNQNQRFVPPLLGDGFNENFSPNRPFTPMPQGFSQPFNGFQPNQNNQSASVDMQPLDYYPPNAPIPANQYNCGPPLLSPEVPNFHNEQKSVNFGMPNHDMFGHNEDMRWRREDNRYTWDRRDHDHRLNRDPRTYREYREMRESRDPRVTNRDPRAMRDPRVNRDLRENGDTRESRDPRDRDPRMNKDRDSDGDRSRFRDSQTRDNRPNRYDSKFDRMYSRTNRDRSRSASRSYPKETFASPLDSLYSEKEKHKTGKGYGVQHFRIPKIKKEDEDNEQSTKVSSSNEEVPDPSSSVVNDETIDSTNNETTNTEVVVNTEQNEEAKKIENDELENAKCVIEKEVEVEKSNHEPPKLDGEIEETKEIEAPALTPAVQPVEQDQAKPADQTILAQFFANLLGSQNKRDKKTALYSLISTFSDTFSEKELTKITKIIKADDEAETSEDEEEVKKSEQISVAEVSKEPEKEADVEETHADDSPVKTKRKTKRRIRRISSAASLKDEKNEEETKVENKEENKEEESKEVVKIPEPGTSNAYEEGSVVVSVGERIKSRKRLSTIPPKPKKKCKTELDLLHEDIQEMFIRDGVLTASGKRMCRLLKTDPSALTTPQTVPAPESQKIRKKPGPKPKQKQIPLEMKSVKSIRILIPKMPDYNFEQKEESPRRNLRSSTKASYAESDEEDNSLPADDDSILGGGSVREEESDAESSDTEKDKTPQAADGKKAKATKRKRGKGWASGNIPSSKKKKKQSLVEESVTKTGDNDSTAQSDADKSFVEPDRNYYIDCVTSKSHECKLCDHKGRFITQHYKTHHPESEVLTSRFSPAAAHEAIEDSKKNLAKYEDQLIPQSGKFHFTCRFCAFNTTVPSTIFYDHITTHTGEYRHICPMCDFSAPSGKTLKAHMSTVHYNIKKRVARKSYSQTILFAYMCGECNYVQLNKKHVEDHINIFHLQKPKIYKVNMSTTLDPEIVKLAEAESKRNSDGAAMDPEEKNKDEQPVVPKEKKNKVDNVEVMPPPEPKKRSRPAPKSVKERLKAKRALKERHENSSINNSLEGSGTDDNTESERATPTQSPVKPAAVIKRRLTREVSASEEDLIIVRGRRAAKDKATEKLKTLMELTETGQRKKSLPSTGDNDKYKIENTESREKEEVAAEPAQEKPDQTVDVVQEVPPIIKKEIEMNVFTCKTDIQEENKKIQQERLQLMEELNKSVGSRTSLNFVDKLCNRLSNKDIMVKQEPADELTDNFYLSNTYNTAPLAMPVLEKNLPTHSGPTTAKVVCTPTHSKKPVLGAEDVHVSNSNFDVTQKNDKVITDMILKLKGKLANVPDDKSESPMTLEDVDYDSEGPPPLTHVNELTNVKPADGSTQTLLIGGFLKVIKYPSNLMFSCLVPPCVFSTENRDAFQKHCTESHKQQDSSTLCEICGMGIASTPEVTLLENVFKHAIHQHADFINTESKFKGKEDFMKPGTSVLRIRKLSGDALSIKKDWDEEIDKTAIASPEPDKKEDDREYQSSVADVTVEETNTPEEPPPTMTELDVSDDNPFPFKIAGVMSLAEPMPPLAPIAKPSPGVISQLVVKEAKLTPAELGIARKTSKAMTKFIASVSDLYKCPHYYCLFSTNFRDFLERHLKAHKLEPEAMIPCVYCDMKTPWEHVPMHIDIRHAHCRYACSYCLYRAVAKEYVFLHQDRMHPDNDYSVIALPQHKHVKKWAIADVKIDPKTLCLPYKCTAACDVEFLFENEFRRHLQTVHKSNFIGCGYTNCTHRVQANKMPNHWALSHCVAVFQCGNCKMNSQDMMKLYQHYAFFHQGSVPDILIRKHAQLQEGISLGYTPEAFAALRKVVTIPSNIVGNKLEISSIEPKTVPVILPNTPYGPQSKSPRQVVTALPQTVGKGVILPAGKAFINHAITLVTSPTTSASNILLLPSVTSGGSCTTLSGIVMASQSHTQSTSVCNTYTVSASPGVTMAIPSVQETVPAGNDDSPAKDDASTEKDGRDLDLSIAPLEHITLSEEDNNQGNEEADTCEADPLSLDADADADLNDAAKLGGDSSGDESDGTKADKPKKDDTSGLIGYQLYRCAFCDISFSNSVDFKRHATYSLTCRKEEPVVKPFLCVHCGKQLKNPHILVEHVQCHGVLRFACSLCGSKFPTITQTRNHIKSRHNITHTLMTPLNPTKQNPDIDEYVVRPKPTNQAGAAKDTSLAESPDVASGPENIYTPETSDQIPMRHILSSSVKCGLCSYSTKVRTNMVRHLQFHSEEKAVPDTAPVNPVPCLEKNEKMFDKMVNLASSSHANSRMGGSKPDSKEKETEKYPEYVPSYCRYVCCAHGCNYMCPEEGNLRHHLIALHDSEVSFTCVHCKINLTPTDADNLIKHFKLHSLQLYKCQHCYFLHHLKHKVEKHSSDNHPDLPAKAITIRFMESEPKDSTHEPSNSNSQVTTTPATSNKIYKPWRCCMCKYKSGTEKGIQTHVSEKHEIDTQFMCALCAYKTNDQETFTDHFKVTHDNQTVDVIHAYRKMEEDKEKEPETFDTTPLWQRDRPRVRHIRGILFDESTPTATKSPKKVKTAAAAPSPGPSGVPSRGPSPVQINAPSSVANAMKCATPPPGPSGVKSVSPYVGIAETKIPASSATSSKSRNSNLDLAIESVANGTADILKASTHEVSDDFFQTVNKLMKESNDDIAKLKDSLVIVIEDEDEPKTPVAKNKDNKDAPVAKNRHLKRKGVEVAGISSKILKISDEIIDLETGDSDTEQDEFSERSLKVRFGGFGAPLWKQFKCPVCNMFKSKRIPDFVFHLFKEMKTFRFKCRVCSDESITYRYMYKHVKDHHLNDDNIDDDITSLPPNEKLLTWLQMVIREQSVTIMQNYPKFPQPVSMGVRCTFCTDYFQTEQDRNEHSVCHWTTKPYLCCLCTYESFVENDVRKHFKAAHEADVPKMSESAMVLANGPTVEKLLNISDEQHISETHRKRPSRAAELRAILPKPVRMDQVNAPVSLTCEEAIDVKGDDGVISDSDLIIITKTDSNVPADTDVFCCDYCAFMANSEVQVHNHIKRVHEHMGMSLKKVDRMTCENPNEHVGCTLCPEVGSEIRIRQHYMEKHDGNPFNIYRFQCSLCPQQKRFLKFQGLKVHFNRMHVGLPVRYTSLYDRNFDVSGLKTYKCPICPYVRNLKSSTVNNMRQHLRQHFKAFKCGICKPSLKYKTRAEVVAHCNKEHAGSGEEAIWQDPEQLEKYNTTMAEIIASAVEVPVAGTVKNTARKSTSAPHVVAEMPEYSFYGSEREEVDLSKIMTSVEVNGMHLNMSAEKLAKIFDLNVTVAIEDCNLAVNLSNVFDS